MQREKWEIENIREGFEKVVAQVAGIEKTLAIADLAGFTPAGS